MESASASPNSSRLGAEQLHALRRRFRADPRIPLPDRGPGRVREGDGACPPRQRHSCFEHLLHPRPRLGHEAPDPPVQEGLPDGFGDHVAGADRDEVPVRGAQVVPLGFESRDGGGLGRTSELRLGRHGEVDVEVGVRAAHCRGILTLPEPGGRELPHGNEHGEERQRPPLVLADEAAVDELQERPEQVGRPRCIRGDRLGGVEAEVAREHAEAREQRLRILAQQVDAPLDRRADRALPLRDVARSGREEREDAVEPREHRGGRQGADPRCRELERERHALERLADAHDIRRVLGGQVEPGISGPGAIPEHPHSRGLEQLLDRGLGVFLRKGKRFDVEDVLAPHAQPGAARHEERRAGERGQQGEDIHGGRDHLLEVVEHDEVAAAGARRSDLLVEGAVARVAHPEVAGDRRQHVGGLAHLREADERHAVESPLREPGDLDGEAGLADAARADEGDEALHIPAQPVQEGCDLRLAADGARGRRGDAASDGGHVGCGIRHVVRSRGRLRAGCVESLGEQGREVGRDEVRELVRGGERRVRRGAVVADPRDERVEPFVAFGGLLDVDELRHLVRREPVLVLEAGDLLTRRDPAVLLPVDAHEHVALREVGAIQLLRRVRPRPELEHHRREVQPFDRAARGGAFRFQFAEGGADEDPQALVWRSDHWRGGRTVHDETADQRAPRVRCHMVPFWAESRATDESPNEGQPVRAFPITTGSRAPMIVGEAQMRESADTQSCKRLH